MEHTENLALPYIAAAQAQKHITHNEALRALDAIVHIAVLDKDLAVPPLSPVSGTRYIIADSATGDWLGKDNQIAAFQDHAWAFYPPKAGWLAWVSDEDKLYAFDDFVWAEVSGSSSGGNTALNPADGNLIGINATADSTNKLSVKSDAILFSHDDVTPGNGSIQTKLNKDTDTDTASLLYQSGWSGRAEMGLTGDNDFHIKVSADGSSWNEAMIVNAVDGTVSFPNSTFGGSSTDPVNVTMTAANKDEPAFKMIGMSSWGTTDNAEGVGLYLTYNKAGNRQFVLADTQTKKGVRFVGTNIEGFQNGSRKHLNIGTSTTGASIGHKSFSNAKFTSSNWDDDVTKIVCAVTGASGQTGHLLEISSQAYNVPRGDALIVKANKDAEFGGTVKFKGYTVATMPNAGSSGAGSQIFVSDETGGSVMAFSDGTDWRRCTDRVVVS